jgi:hypothetical protein
MYSHSAPIETASRQKLVSSASAILVVAGLTAAQASGQGFGSDDLLCRIVRVYPPQVYLARNRLAIEVKALGSLSPRIADNVREDLEGRLQRLDPRLIIDRVSSETLIACTLSASPDSSAWQTRTRKEYRWVGSHMETDPDTGAMRTVQDYDWVDVSYRAYAVDARWSVSFEIKDVETGLLLAADRFEVVFARDLHGQSLVLDSDEANSHLEQHAVNKLLERLAPAARADTHPLPKGKLRPQSVQLSARNSDRALQMLLDTPAFPKPRDDAYRQYLLGLCYESKAYATSDPSETLRQIDLAVRSYRQAVALNPNKDVFWQVLHLAGAQAHRYQETVNQIEAFKEARGLILAEPVASRQSLAGDLYRDTVRRISSQKRREPLEMTNQAVIDLLVAGKSEDYIVGAVRSAPSARYDLSPAGQHELKQAGATERVLRALKNYTRRPGPPSRRTFYIVSVATSLLWMIPFLFR